MDKKWVKRIALFCLMIGFMFSLLVLRVTNDYDRDFVKFKLPRASQAHYVIDLGKEGGLKYFVQPNIYTVYFRLQPQEKNVKLTCRSEGVQMILSQGSKKGIWTKLSPEQELHRERGQLPVSVELYVPRDSVQKYDVGKGKLLFYDGDKLYATILVEIVNSRYEK